MALTTKKSDLLMRYQGAQIPRKQLYMRDTAKRPQGLKAGSYPTILR